MSPNILPWYAPTSNATGHDNHEKINSRVSFSFLYKYGATLGDPWGRRSSATKTNESRGAYQLAKKSGNVRLKVKWNCSLPESPFGNCRLPPDLVLLFRSGRNDGNFLTIWYWFYSYQSLISGKQSRKIDVISFSGFVDFGKTPPIIQRPFQPVYSDKWKAPQYFQMQSEQSNSIINN